jgi:1-acyl-sn-glycerol-3-phosphate acyltransferase
MSLFPRRFYLVTIYRLSWILFAVGGVLLNLLVCAPMLLLPGRAKLGSKVRSLIRFLFKLWVQWMHFTGVARIEFHGFETKLTPGTVFIANHPSLLDATFLLAHLPNAACIFKPLLMRNPATGPAAIMAGYVSASGGVDLIREATNILKRGISLLVFPEGTRTLPGQELGKLKGGFAMIAARAEAPVQLILVRTSQELARRGNPWWTAPKELPAVITCSLDRVWLPDPNRSAAELAQEVEAYMNTKLVGNPV